MNSMDAPESSTSEVSRSTICRCVIESNAVVGSSAMISLGEVINAVAMPTRCCWPPDS